jgi:dihydroflavonol-4-reductase
MGAYGIRAVFDETTEAHPIGPYESSKYAAERVVLNYHQESGMQTTALRPSVVFGEGRKPESDSFLEWVKAVNARRFAHLRPDSVSCRVYVGDVVAACLMLTSNPQSGGQAFIVNEPVPLTSFVADMASILGVSPPPVLPKVVGSVSERLLRLAGRFRSFYNLTVYRMDRLSNLGFVLPFGYQEGLRRTIAWYRQAGLLPSKPSDAAR